MDEEKTELILCYGLPGRDISRCWTFLLSEGTDVNAHDKKHGITALSWASYKGDPAVVDLLLAQGADVHTRDRRYGNTSLLGRSEGARARG